MALTKKQRRIFLAVSLVCILCAIALAMVVYGMVFSFSRSKIVASLAVAAALGVIGVVFGLLLKKTRRAGAG